MAVGSTSPARTVTLTNRQAVALNFTGIAISGPPFAIATNTCGAGIAAGAGCTVGVTFTPTATNSFTGALTFTDSGPNSPQTVTLTGTGGPPVTLSTNSLSFGSLAIGNVSSARTVTLTNLLAVPANFTSIAATGPIFAIAGNTCGSSVPSGARCTVGVTFSPSATGSVSGTLAFTDAASNSPQTVSLSGSGTAPVTLSTTSLNFGTVAVGSTSSTRSVTLTNRQNVALTVSSIATAGSFTVVSSTCGSSLAVNASCSVGVTFAPKAAGPATGTLAFTDSAATSPQSVSLTGTGQ